ncbi:MAG: aminotransferase class III-fold pyridoxal phosphate-dependent enzyme, partial [Actinobacteria bacterium]|nr:aminotransferase class III-fold pyridoxal phosphate-dependent enzyme [Actinomycetota bacterium]
MRTVDRTRLAALMQVETQRFIDTHPKSAAHAQTTHTLIGGVPMPWMRRWPGPFPLVLDAASGARFTDIDGHEYVDLCLGDTGAMTGHAHREVGEAVSKQLARGATVMLPTPDAVWVANELERRFGLPKWQFALSATDANRFALRFARAITGKHLQVPGISAILPQVQFHDPHLGRETPSIGPTVALVAGSRCIARGPDRAAEQKSIRIDGMEPATCVGAAR